MVTHWDPYGPDGKVPSTVPRAICGTDGQNVHAVHGMEAFIIAMIAGRACRSCQRTMGIESREYTVPELRSIIGKNYRGCFCPAHQRVVA